MGKTIYTIGHSIRTTKEFITILKSYDIDLLVDVRHYPGSRHCPQFGKARLKQSLERNDMEYKHLVELGGRRPPIKSMELNLGWRSLQFRGYADYMQSNAFKDALKELIDLMKRKKTVIMCAEAVPWRCHRSLVGDALLIRGFEVQDIFTKSKCKPHKLTPFAKVSGKNITYPMILTEFSQT